MGECGGVWSMSFHRLKVIHPSIKSVAKSDFATLFTLDGWMDGWIAGKIHHVFTGSPRVARAVCRVTGAIAPQPPRSDATTCMVDLQ